MSAKSLTNRALLAAVWRRMRAAHHRLLRHRRPQRRPEAEITSEPGTVPDWIGGRGSRYYDFVWRAVTDGQVFRTFRSHPDYRRILEHVSQRAGFAYLAAITDPLVYEICLTSEYADVVGLPEVFLYDNRRLSPTTLRYAKVLNDLVTLFPAFSTFDAIVEIGIGYGGQARLIAEFAARANCRLQTYTLVDILPVIHLSRLYLEHFNLIPGLSYETKSTLRRTDTWNLVISNYAFSEFNYKLQEEYLSKILRRTPHGYLTMNSGLSERNEWGERCFTAEELIQILPNAVMLREEPRTGPNNYIIVYGGHIASTNL